ncbi:MAG: DUF378 domain-containing protein [Candidatus Daviesbacteria bacterium]|nr:DUF378 domain-containing protein [Candidatus Daviesbacteria bacterium]
MAAFILVVVGAINWGLVALLGLNLVDAVLGSMPQLAQLVYILVGASGVYLLTTHMGDCKACGK